MRVNDLLAEVDRLHPNQFTTTEKLAWLNRIEQTIWHEIICTHEGVEEGAEMPVYQTDEQHQTVAQIDTELLAQDPYSRLYPAWMDAMIAYHNREGGKYADAMNAFNEAYTTFANWYNRTHMPIGAVDHLHLVDRRW